MIQITGGILVRDGMLLLGRRASYKRVCPDTWDIIGGHVEAGETIEQALMRELKEEIGVMSVAMTRLGSLPFVDGTEAVELHVFRIDAWIGEPALANNEHTELRWFTVAAASALADLAAPEYVDLFRMI